MANSQLVALHIGAHKTATTHLQHCLQGARSDLRDAGVRLFGPAQLRGPGQTLAERFSLPFVARPENAHADSKGMLKEMRDGVERLVISEENFVGVLNRKGGRMDVPLYPNAVERIAALASVIAPEGIDVFLGIRAPAPFLNSVYSQVLLSGNVVAPPEFRRLNQLGAIDWAAYLKKLQRIKSVRSLVVWPYEDYEALFGRITALMVGAVAAEHVSSVAKVVHSGLSARAVEEILSTGAKSTTAESARLARSRFPISDQYPKFDVFTGKDHATSGLQYADQLTEIAEMPAVTLLRA